MDRTDSFPVWKTIEIGGYNANTMKEALVSAGNGVSDWAGDLLKKTKFTKGKRTINLVRVDYCPELGFTKPPTYEQLFATAKARGLLLCPPEVGPQLRLQYPDQPAGEQLRIAMEPIIDSFGHPYVFCVPRYRYVDGVNRWLCGFSANPAIVWGADDFWVFFLPH